VTHLLSRFHLPTTQIERGWINTNALTLIDLEKMEAINTVLLDNIDSGAANPWAAAWTADGKSIVVTHAGTHELTVIDAPALLAKLAKLGAKPEPGAKADYASASQAAADVPNDLSFLVGLRRRIRLPDTDRGPRALALAGAQALVANYFSDTLSLVSLEAERPDVKSVALGAKRAPLSVVRQGELNWNDASICFQGWQSCSSCHSSDARVDGLNWDNLNDGIGNPKNAKSMLQAHQTPPSMWLGVRANASVSVRAGIRNSMFTVQPEETAAALDEYLKSLRPIASPLLVKGRLSPAAERGKELFFSKTAGCANCHSGPLYTDMKFHDVGTVGKFDKPTDRFDTPSLIEIWRSAPYLHNGSAATVRDVLTGGNAADRHGRVRHLKPGQIDDLCAFLLSL
jgi:cytochrome c peroxidase